MPQVGVPLPLLSVRGAEFAGGNELVGGTETSSGIELDGEVALDEGLASTPMTTHPLAGGFLAWDRRVDWRRTTSGLFPLEVVFFTLFVTIQKEGAAVPRAKAMKTVI